MSIQCGVQDGTAGPSSQTGCTIQHLPPMFMRIDLPSNYPSEQPPILQMSAPWLTHQQLQQLQHHLTSLWADSPGLPICYTWVDWLQQDSLNHLGLSETLDLSPFVPKLSSQLPQQEVTSVPSSSKNGNIFTAHHQEGESDTVSDQDQSAEEVLLMLVQFDVAEKQHAFQEGTWTCGICFEQMPGRQCIQASLQCGHIYCQDCMRQHCALHVNEGSLQFLRCPQPDCQEPLDRQVGLCLHPQHAPCVQFHGCYFLIMSTYNLCCT